MNNGRRGNLTNFDRRTEAEAIRDNLPRHHNGRFGFNIYRVSSGEDDEFARFIQKLTAHAHAELDRDDTGDQIRDMLDWNVQDEPDLRGATIGEVRG